MRKAITILSFTISTILSGQNLVPDGSFELNTACPLAGDVNYNLYWTNPTAGTPDYFHTCSSSSFTSVPNNIMGSQPAFGGAYVGVVTKLSSDFKEYVEVALLDSLDSGISYCVSFYVSLAGKSGYATQAPQLYFSNSAISSTVSSNLPYTPQIVDTSIISDTINWTLISGTYIASGGEKYITIGNFNADSNTPSVFIGFSSTMAYFYIDSVSVVNCVGSIVESEQTFASSIILFPNPTKQKSTLQFNNYTNENFTLTIFDCKGQLVQKIFNITENRVEIEKQNLTNGIYFYQLQSKEKKASGKIIIEVD